MPLRKAYEARRYLIRKPDLGIAEVELDTVAVCFSGRDMED